MIPESPLPKTTATILEGIEKGLHIGAQLYISRLGKIIADLAFGESRPGVLMKPDTLMLWMSATKPITAVAIAQLWEPGLLQLDDSVAHHIPEFAAAGKEAITIRHLLTHTGGFRGVAMAHTEDAWDSIITRICATRLESGWTPGKKAGYHIASSWFILGEIVQRLSGERFDHYVRKMIFQPIGMNDSWIGMPAEAYRSYGDRIGIMHDTSVSPPRVTMKMDTETGCGQIRPAAGGHGPARELAFFYEAMLWHGQRNGTRILSPQTVEVLTARHRVGMFDHTFKHVMDWGLGFIINSAQYGVETVPYGFGRYASPRTFGHGGAQSSVAFGDPEYGLAVAVVFNGMPGDEKHQERLKAVTSAIYEDLGLA